MLKKILSARERLQVCQEFRLYVAIRNQKKGFYLSSSNQ